ncbi:MAG: hypothetical protein P1U82_22625 [Verrucomicrobiales bacterium]|jgi:hypothetical protein|nr:hypothetical protein [Verrucomicrobiales bacterium]
MKDLPPALQALLSWCLFMALWLPTDALKRSAGSGVPPFAVEAVGVVTTVFLACIVAYWFLHKAWFPVTRKQLYLIGLIWVVLTLMFQALRETPLSALYRINHGKLFLVGHMALLFVPMAVAQRNRVIE